MLTFQRPDKRIRAFFSDIDGCQTDGGMYFGPEGQAIKRFNVKDGYIVAVLQQAGVKVIWVTADDSDISRARARRLGIDELVSGVKDKGIALFELKEKYNLETDETVYLGDDLNDLPAFAQAGLTTCPADAVPQVLAVADYMAEHNGGHGAFREIADLILSWNDELEQVEE